MSINQQIAINPSSSDSHPGQSLESLCRYVAFGSLETCISAHPSTEASEGVTAEIADTKQQHIETTWEGDVTNLTDALCLS